jgi:1,4-dihydroxy-2-naphthoyl-CoA hydrolase
MLNKSITPEILNKNAQNALPGHIGIEVTEIGDEYVCGKMPVDYRTHQPYGILHGGASVVLAESLGSIGATLSVDLSQYQCVGLDINANHIRSVKSGYVYGKAVPLHIGKSTHVWEIKITDEEGKLVCISRITMAIVKINN